MSNCVDCGRASCSIKSRKCKCGLTFNRICRSCFERLLDNHMWKDNCHLLQRCFECKEYNYKHTTRYECKCGWVKSYCPGDTNVAELDYYVEQHHEKDCPDYIYLPDNHLTIPIDLLYIQQKCNRCKCIKTLNHTELCPLICYMNHKFEVQLESLKASFDEKLRHMQAKYALGFDALWENKVDKNYEQLKEYWKEKHETDEFINNLDLTDKVCL